jgi:hypothetical protein
MVKLLASSSAANTNDAEETPSVASTVPKAPPTLTSSSATENNSRQHDPTAASTSLSTTPSEMRVVEKSPRRSQSDGDEIAAIQTPPIRRSPPTRGSNSKEALQKPPSLKSQSKEQSKDIGDNQTVKNEQVSFEGLHPPKWNLTLRIRWRSVGRISPSSR